MREHKGQSSPSHAGEYEVGYGKPPQHSRWQPGQSGNPAGAKKKPRPNSIFDDLREELQQKVTVREAGREIEVTKQRALVKAMIANGLNPRSQASLRLLDFTSRLAGLEDDADASGVELSKAERQILDDLERRIFAKAKAGHNGDAGGGND